MAIPKCNPTKCKSCIFGQTKEAVQLSPGREVEIREYLLQGTNHICHTTDLVCTGGREYQAEMWYRIGMLKEPTVACLEETVNKMGPKE